MKALRLHIKCLARFPVLLLLAVFISSCSKAKPSGGGGTIPPVPVAGTLVLRSAYEKPGDEIYDVNLPGEGASSYSIISGNSQNYYSIGAADGKVKILQPIPDVIHTVRIDTLKVKAGSETVNLFVADGFDYTIQHLPNGYTVMKNDNETYADPNSEWTASNNLWGKGTAVPEADFRIATVHKSSATDTAIFIWDVPGPASDFGGASVWCYVNKFWGNKKNVRENVAGFPFKIGNVNTLSLDFDFEKLYGNDDYKIAMNMFMTNESYLTNFSSNDGDLFFVFDQIGTFIPGYPYSLPDTVMNGKTFARRYDTDAAGYEWRRVIVKNGDKWLSGTLDVKKIFGGFIAAGYLNPQQYIYHIQLGLEITNGFGAVRFNKAQFVMTPK